MTPRKKLNCKPPVVLTIAGSDSGGGAGIQADLKTFQVLGVFGTSAITCVTAQNPDGVRGIAPLTPRMVALQIKAVGEGFPVAAAKTGMLYSAAIVAAVADAVRACRIPRLVVDPVMIATSGARLLQSNAVRRLCSRLLPMATVVTPNLYEAEVICGHSIASLPALKKAAHAISERYGVACAIKGGHLAGRLVVDVLVQDGQEHLYVAPRLQAVETHGTGCAFSAALTAYLARGMSLPESVGLAKQFVYRALKQARCVGKHRPLLFLPRLSEHL